MKAPVLYAGIDNRQAFIDGNKRMAFFAVQLFYDFAGFVFDPPEDEMYELAMHVANQRPVDRDMVARKFEQWTTRDESAPDY